MLGFNKLQEAAKGTYSYYPARSTAKTKFFVIDMGDGVRDVVVSFTNSTESGIASKSKKTWFATVSAMKNGRGGATIKQVPDPEMLANTIASITNDFQLQYKPRNTYMRIDRRGKGRMFDVGLRQKLKSFGLKSVSTKLVDRDGEVDESDYTFYQIGRTLSLDESQYHSHLSPVAAKMASEIDPSSQRKIVVTVDDSFAAYDKDAVDKWAEENPARKVSADVVTPSVMEMSDLHAIRIRQGFNSIVESNVDAACIRFKQAAMEVTNSTVGLIEFANRLVPYIDAIDMEAPFAEKFVSDVMSLVQESFQLRTESISRSLFDQSQLTEADEALVSKYIASPKAVDEYIAKGSGSQDELIESLDDAFSSAGFVSGSHLFKQATMSKERLTDIIENERIDTLTFDSASLVPKLSIGNNVVTGLAEAKDAISSSNMVEMQVTFVFEPNVAQILPPHRTDESTVIINRGSVFGAKLVSVNESSAVIHLTEYNDSASIFELTEAQHKARSLHGLAKLLTA